MAMQARWRLLVLACVLAGLFVPALASASPVPYAETRIRGLDLGNPYSVRAERPVTLGTQQGYGLAYDDLASGSLLAARGVIRTPYGTAAQSASRAAGEARQAVEGGATLYRGGTLGRSAGPEGQFWSLENPLSPGYAQRYGTPGSAFDFVETGHLPPGTNFITREAPGLGAHSGGAIEVVVDPGAVSLTGFYMP
jgi:hypothetical protein